jgi:hypothetical protein
MLALALHNQDGNKVLQGLDLDALTPAKIKHTLLVGGLCMREWKPREFSGQVGNSYTTMQVLVDTLAP